MAGDDGAAPGSPRAQGQGGAPREEQAASGAADGGKTAAALATVQAVVAEIRALRGQEEGEALNGLKARLAAAIKAARAAGVPQAELIEASKPRSSEGAEPEQHGGPGRDAADEGALRPGDEAEIYGLESETGKLLNGKTGRLAEYNAERGRFQVELGADNTVSVKPSNLRRIPPAQHGGAAEDAEKEAQRPLEVGDSVEIAKLESESGMKLNGRVGTITEYISDKGRFKIELEQQEFVSIKAENLIRRSPPACKRPRSPSRSSSSSSSSTPSKRAKGRRVITPEEQMEKLLKSVKPKLSTAEKASEAAKKRKKAEEEEEQAAAEAAKKKTSAEEEEEQAAEAARSAGAAAAAAAAARPPAVDQTTPLKPGEPVEVHGLQSESGRKLNGKTGLITKFVEEKGRFQVELGLPTLQSLKPENLKRLSTPGAPHGGGGASVGDNYGGSTAGYTLL